MTDAIPLLDEAMLEELRDRWAEQGAPIVDNLRPGLRDATIDELMSPLGLRLPTEARTWWSWHDGAVMPDGGHAELSWSSRYYSLENRVQEYRFQRELAFEAWDGDEDAAERWWPQQMFAFTDFIDGSSAMIDCSGATDSPTTVWFHPKDDLYKNEVPGARSLGELVSWWIQAYADGGWTWDEGSRRWLVDQERLPAAGRAVGLVH